MSITETNAEHIKFIVIKDKMEILNKLSRKQIILLGILIIVIPIAIILIIFINSLINNATIEVLVAPESSTITIDGRKISNGEIKVTPGTHEISAEKTGFTTQTINVSVEKNSSAQAFIILESNSDDTKDWFTEHAEDQAIVEQILGEEFNQESASASGQYPIMDDLPYESMNYSIDYGSCDENTFCILIDVDYMDRDTAVKAIKELTDTPEKYSYVFSDYANPFNLSTSSSSQKTSPSDAILDIFKDYRVEIENISTLNEYTVATIKYYINDFPDINTYRVIIKKDGSLYKLASVPELILTIKNNPDIPENILSAANKL